MEKSSEVENTIEQQQQGKRRRRRRRRRRSTQKILKVRYTLSEEQQV